MKEKEFITPEYTTAQEIREIRTELCLTQQEFANLMRCSKPTVVRWEASKEPITGPVVVAVYALKNTSLRENCILPEMQYPLRLIYMYRQTICTIIDADERSEKIDIINYTSKIMFRAFGANKNPSYEDFNDFLESRCFPRTRDKLKLELEKLGLPFYDPLMIIEKTQGRMAEDEFWIKVVRQ